MENDKNDLNNTENLLTGDVYKIEHSNQNVDNNIKYQKWKKDMLNKYGNNLILVNCNKDNVIFCAKREKKKSYKFKCPICDNFICSFCLKSFNSDFHDCCIRGRFKTILHDTPECAEGIFVESIEYLLLIPFISFIYVIGGIFNSLFFRLVKPLTFKKQSEYSHTYSDHDKYKSRIIYSILFGFKVLFAITNLVSFLQFLILDALLTIIILIISIPFKFYPIKYVFGMFVALYDDVM